MLMNESIRQLKLSARLENNESIKYMVVSLLRFFWINYNGVPIREKHARAGAYYSKQRAGGGKAPLQVPFFLVLLYLFNVY